ncbi:MAG: hypothetical protein R3F61_32150 [Myxococcota bacterium]
MPNDFGGPAGPRDLPEGDEKTTWVPSTESMDPGELTSWISNKNDQPDFERTESRGARRPPPTPDFHDLHEATGVVHTPRKRSVPTPEPAPVRRTTRHNPKALPTPEPAPRRRTQRAQPVAPTPKAPRPPTPEPAPPRRTRRATGEADEEPSLTIPRRSMADRTPMPQPTPAPRTPAPHPPAPRTPAPGRTPTPSPVRTDAVPRPAMPVPRPPSMQPVPQPPVPVPDTWTPAPSGEHRDALYGRDDPSTEVEHSTLDAHGFPHTPDVPSTVISDDSIDEVPPTPSPLPHIPNDAPTVVRPDLAQLAEVFDTRTVPSGASVLDVSGVRVSPHDDTIGSALEPIAGSTADALHAYDEQPPGEPTVALPPPSQRKNTQVRQPTPEPAPDALPKGASYSPPTGDIDRNEMVKGAPAKGTPAPARAVKRPPPASGKRPKSNTPAPAPSAKSASPRKLPKNASIVSGKDPFPTEAGGRISNLTLVYGAVVVFGLLLVVAAFVLGLIVLALS